MRRPSLPTLLRIAALAAACAAAVGCAEEETAPPTVEAPSAEPPAPGPMSEAPPAPPAPAQPAGPPPPAAGPTEVVGACSRVHGCCRAFHEASGAATTPCDPYGLMPSTPDPNRDPGCAPTIDGYRRSLERMGLPIPDACR